MTQEVPANEKAVAEGKVEEKGLSASYKPLASRPEMVMKQLPLFDTAKPKEDLKLSAGGPAKGAFNNPLGFFRA